MPYVRIVEPKPNASPAVKTDGPPKKYLVRRSRKLPNWLWAAVACILGIQRSGQDKPFWANIFYYCTFLSALVFFCSTLAFTITTAMFNHQRQPAAESTLKADKENYVFDAAVILCLTIFWCCLGLYAHNLAARLYSSSRMVDMIRLHSKTIFKLNAALVFFFLLTAFVVIDNCRAYSNWFSSATPCLLVEGSTVICRVRFVSQCVFAVFTVLWNSLVGLVLLSVCRTHTMGIRSFIQDLEKEAQLYESKRFGKTAAAEDLLWLNGNDADVSSETDEDANPPSSRKPYSTVSAMTLTPVRLEHLLFSPISKSRENDTKRQNLEAGVELETLSGHLNAPPQAPPLEPQQPMSNAVILQRYWKLSCSMRMSSLTFQRWTCSVTAISLAWISVNLVQWVPRSPSLLAIAGVAIPLLILLLLCAAYAEVNFEGKRLLKCICPMEERLNALLVLWKSPLQLTVFGVPLSYTSISTVACALLIALVSRVALKQIGTN